MIEIQKSVPVPRGGKRAWGLYPFGRMEDGDSFFVPEKTISTVGSCAKEWAKRNAPERKFTCRTVTEDGVKGVRCWRVA